MQVAALSHHATPRIIWPQYLTVALIPGSRIGSYEILTLLGAGGMGEVYRARDRKLNRDVALKVLPAALRDSAERLSRFQREAQLLAGFNHPHIAQIYGFEDSGGTQALVMELIEGPTLEDRIAQGPMTIAEVLPIAHQIAEALEAAHEQGVVHRDLKPANIKVKADGAVRVLDFGLAKALEVAEAAGDNVAHPVDRTHSPTRTAAETQRGVILGTAAYMSPEQARGKAVDKRVDIWAFGCVLFEMLSGAQAFGGETASDSIARVLGDDPNWSQLPVSTPTTVRRLLTRCLERDPKQRLHDIADARLEIEDAIGHKIDKLSPSPTSSPRRFTLMSLVAVAVVASLFGVIGAFVALHNRGARTSKSGVLRLTAELGAPAMLANTNLGASAVLSPDGRSLVFVAQKGSETPQLYVRRLDQLRAVPLAGTEHASSPFFSPDGQWIGFFAEGKLRKIPVIGGAEVVICDAPDGRGGTWSEDGTIIFTPDSRMVSLWRVSASGGTPKPLTKLDSGEMQHKWPQVLPGGLAVVFTSHTSTNAFDNAQLVVQRLKTGERTTVLRGGYYARYVPSGHLLYIARGTLFALPFDLDRLTVAGPAMPVIEGVATNQAITGGAQYSVSNSGAIAYVPGPSLNLEIPVQWMYADGHMTTLRPATTNWTSPRFSPDGQRLAMEVRDARQNQVYVVVYDWRHDTLIRLASSRNADVLPVWTPDGRHIVFSRHTGGESPSNLYVQRSDGTGEVQRVTESMNTQFANSWSPNGRFLAFTENNPTTQGDVMILSVDGDEISTWKHGTVTALLNGPADEGDAMFSPDGHWLAYDSDESGRFEVYVRPFPGADRKWAVSTGGGSHPRWSNRRHELFYGTPDGHIMVAPYTVDRTEFHPEKPRLWSQGRFQERVNDPFDLHPDGDRFAVAELPDFKQDRINLIFNFFDELRRFAPVSSR